MEEAQILKGQFMATEQHTLKDEVFSRQYQEVHGKDLPYDETAQHLKTLPYPSLAQDSKSQNEPSFIESQASFSAQTHDKISQQFWKQEKLQDYDQACDFDEDCATKCCSYSLSYCVSSDKDCISSQSHPKYYRVLIPIISVLIAAIFIILIKICWVRRKKRLAVLKKQKENDQNKINMTLVSGLTPTATVLTGSQQYTFLEDKYQSSHKASIPAQQADKLSQSDQENSIPCQTLLVKINTQDGKVPDEYI